ncbi:TraB/GumN family protein [Paracoccus caeni]|uniref:TraB/GumN family protein n=1 Tax=Paracoccus caeni TaxID=657651 RepID=A0A934SD20_9RHOB|nr:TraB/GumN family protein [Paracoccus caeni]MBK4214661.1 TraB/GumN family protein [Paracoccus caeni]
MRLLLTAILVGWTGMAGLASAQIEGCSGTNLFADMPEDLRSELTEAATSVPNPEGILWRATKGDQDILMIGTYHFPDPRHRAMLDRVAPEIADAAALLVEAGPEEEAKLTRALSEDPSLMVDATGPTLPERLDPAEWAKLAEAMSDRGLPAVVTSKLRPWYVAMMLSISPCMMSQIQGETEDHGLDHLLVKAAEDKGIAVKALEPWNTVFTIFADLTVEQELDMIRASLPLAAHADDYAVTLGDAYFDGDIWLIWEFGRFDAYRSSGLSRDKVDEQMDLAQEQLMDKRNQSWIAPLTDAAQQAAADGKGIVAGFGALHLPGEQGVLRLLEKDGWTVERLDG